MSTPQPTSYKSLNDKQISILHLIYRFRFATTDLLAKSLGKKDKSEMNRRLKTLLLQEYIGRKYQPNYHLLGQPASFHLLPKGIQALRSLPETKYDPAVLRNIYKDKTASDRFIGHRLAAFSLYCQLKGQYGGRLRYFTKSELSKFEYFPKPLPDAYLRLDAGNERHFLVDIIDDSQPFFVAVRRVKQYIKYAEEGDWEDATGSKLPVVLLTCKTSSLQYKLSRFSESAVEDSYEDDLVIKVIMQEQLSQILDAKKKARQS
jgi:hypothetical protein